MLRLLIVRHGYTVTNKQGRYTGQLDAPLTDEGKNQAAQLSAYLAEHEQIGKIYASDLSRAINTAAPTAAHFGLEIVPMPELREIDVGEFTGMTFESIRQNENYASIKQDAVTPFPGGESFYDLYLRTEKALQKILAENDEGTVMIVTHAGNVRCFSCMASGESYLASRNHPAIANTAMDIYHVENGKLIRVAHEVKQHLETPASNPRKDCYDTHHFSAPWAQHGQYRRDFQGRYRNPSFPPWTSASRGGGRLSCKKRNHR